VSDFLWFLGILLGLTLLIVAPWVAWYVFVGYTQRVRHARAVQLAERRGLPPPDPPPPPDVLHAILRVNRIGGLLGIAGAMAAIVIFTMITCSHR
jgi:hypothetical protein